MDLSRDAVLLSKRLIIIIIIIMRVSIQVLPSIIQLIFILFEISMISLAESKNCQKKNMIRLKNKILRF